MEPSKIRVRAANGSAIKVFGSAKATLSLNGQTCSTEFLVADVHGLILNLPTCQALDIFATMPCSAAEAAQDTDRADFRAEARETVAAAGLSFESLTGQQLLELYSDVFDDGTAELSTMDVAPYDDRAQAGGGCLSRVASPRPIPLAVLERVKAAVFKLLERGVIRRLEVDEPTDWCAPLHYVMKKDARSGWSMTTGT